MLNILQMWVMVFYFRKRESHLHSVYNIFRDNRYDETSIVGRALEAHSEKEKILVPKSTLKIQFVFLYYIDYWFKKENKDGSFLEKYSNHPEHIRFANKIMLNCLSGGFFHESEENPVHIYITAKGEQFSTFPIGLLREWAIFLKPFGVGFIVGVSWIFRELFPYIAHLLKARNW